MYEKDSIFFLILILLLSFGACAHLTLGSTSDSSAESIFDFLSFEADDVRINALESGMSKDEALAALHLTED